MTRPSFQMSLVQSMNKDWPQHCVYDLTWSLYNGLTTISNLQGQTTRDIREENYDKDTILGRRGIQASSRLENGKKEFWENLIKGRGNDKLAIMEWWKMLKALSVKNIKDIQGEKPTLSIYSTGRFLDALASLDFKLSLSESLIIFACQRTYGTKIHSF